jgi:gliding motility-associated-like protein
MKILYLLAYRKRYIFSLFILNILFLYSATGQCPNLNVPVNPSSSDICIGDFGEVIISNSETDVFYRAYIDGNAVSGQIEGTGGDINIIIPSIQMAPGENEVTIQANPNPAASGNVAIFETSTAPVIDGIPDETSWYLVGDYPHENTVRPLPLSDTFFNAQWGASYDTNYLYLAIRVQDYSLPVAPETTEKFYLNDAVEFLLEGQPDSNHVKINLDCHNQAEQSPIPYAGTHDTTSHLHAAHIDSANNVWSAELRVAWADLGYASPPNSMNFDTYLDFAEPPDSTGLGSKVWRYGKSFEDISQGGTIETVPEDTCDNNLSDIAIITAHDGPVVDAGADTNICPSGDSLSSATGTDYDELLWTTSGDGSFDNDTVLHPFYTPGANDISSGTVTLTLSATGFGSCNDTSDNITLTINPAPTASVTSNVSICDGDTTQLNATGGGTYTWNTTQNGSQITVSPSNNTLYIVTVTNTYGCKDSDTAAVIVNPLPSPNGNDINLHYNTDTVLTIDIASGDYSYQWNPDTFLIAGHDTLASPRTKELTESREFFVSVTNDQTGCSDTTSVNVTITSIPLSVIAGTDTAVDQNVSMCIGDMITLNAFPTGGTGSYSLKWDTVPLNDASLISNSSSIIVSPTETITYVLQANDGVEISKDSITVFVNPLPVTSVQPEDTTVVSNATIPLYAEGGTDYLWQPEKYLIDDDTLQAPRAQPVIPTLFIVRVTNQYGCHSYDTIIVDTMACRLWVPEAFTPNGDQINDVFKAEGFGIDDFNMILFNRWGEQIFESNSLDIGWDGSLNDNTQHIQSVGYLIKATCQDNKTIIEKKGNIYIVK